MKWLAIKAEPPLHHTQLHQEIPNWTIPGRGSSDGPVEIGIGSIVRIERVASLLDMLLPGIESLHGLQSQWSRRILMLVTRESKSTITPSCIPRPRQRVGSSHLGARKHFLTINTPLPRHIMLVHIRLIHIRLIHCSRLLNSRDHRMGGRHRSRVCRVGRSVGVSPVKLMVRIGGTGKCIPMLRMTWTSLDRNSRTRRILEGFPIAQIPFLGSLQLLVLGMQVIICRQPRATH